MGGETPQYGGQAYLFDGTAVRPLSSGTGTATGVIYDGVAGNGGTSAAGTAAIPADGGVPVAGSAGRSNNGAPAPEDDDDSGCSVQPGRSSALWPLLLLSGFALIRRRRAA
jgi:MYXO-CTERM domain-containing protein